MLEAWGILLEIAATPKWLDPPHRGEHKNNSFSELRGDISFQIRFLGLKICHWRKNILDHADKNFIPFIYARLSLLARSFLHRSLENSRLLAVHLCSRSVISMQMIACTILSAVWSDETPQQMRRSKASQEEEGPDKSSGLVNHSTPR